MCRVLQGRKVSPVSLVTLDSQEQMDAQEPLVHQVSKESLAFQEVQVFLDLLD